MKRVGFILILVFALTLLVLLGWKYLGGGHNVIPTWLSGKATTKSRVEQYGEPVRTRLEPFFQQAGVAYPPNHVTLIGLKTERQLELWAGDAPSVARHIKTYPIMAASGTIGPKLREGDQQVPEGFYAIESLNPNSRYHLALRVNYPNAADRARAREEKREHLGGDIMIHGKALSIGCLAMGDPAAEELFVVAALTGLKNIRVLLCPADLRVREIAPPPNAPAWTSALYHDLRTALAEYARR